MAREINWDEQVSDEDRAWLEQRPDMPAGLGMTNAERLADNDARFGKEAQDAKKTRAEQIDEARSQMAELNNKIERLLAEQAAEDNANVAQTGNPASGLVVDNTPVNSERPQGAPEPAQNYSDEKYWTKQRLQAEIDSRNPDREGAGLPPLSKTGTRAELVERLQEDDRLIDQGEQ